MAQENKVEVINRFGWRKEFVLEKPIIQIGRDARNDLVLDDGHENGIAPRHAQLLPSSVNGQGMRLINLSDEDIQVVPSNPAAGAATTIGPRSSAEVATGDQLKLGDFTLVFYGGERRSEVMKLELELAGNELALTKPLAGTLKIQHVGNKAAVQFKIEVEGLDPDSYELGPGPVLFPNAEKQISFRLIHSRRAHPPAGLHRITFHVTAPDAYPGERASISHEIHVAPFYQHRMRVMVMDSLDYRLT